MGATENAYREAPIGQGGLLYHRPLGGQTHAERQWRESPSRDETYGPRAKRRLRSYCGDLIAASDPHETGKTILNQSSERRG
jgi:hypothetical protein